MRKLARMEAELAPVEINDGLGPSPGYPLPRKCAGLLTEPLWNCRAREGGAVCARRARWA